MTTLDQLKDYADTCRLAHAISPNNENYALWKDAERAYAHEASIAIMRGRVSFTQAIGVQKFNRQIGEA